MDVHSQPKIPFTLGFVTGVVVLVQVICIFLPYWMHIDSVETIGLFHSQHEDSSSIFETNCTDDMGELECGYIKSFQISAVITVLFGGITAFLFFISPSYSNDLVAFLAVCGTLLQSTFGLITWVLFLYFKNSYFDDDGVNQEYPTAGESNTHFLVGFWLWVCFNAINWFSTFYGYFVLYLSGYQKKGLLSMY